MPVWLENIYSRFLRKFVGKIGKTETFLVLSLYELNNRGTKKCKNRFCGLVSGDEQNCGDTKKI